MPCSTWEDTRLKHQITMKGRLGWQGLTAEEYQDEGPLVVSSAHFSNYQIRWEACPRVSWERYELDANIQLRDGDVLLMKDGAALGKLAQVGLLPEPACLNSHLLLLRPACEQHPARFLFYLLDSNFFQHYMEAHGKGSTFLGVSQEAIGNFPLSLPDGTTQKAIINFLDRKTAAIDALIEKKQKLLDLLAEKRAALINQAVTKGLDPGVPMKDSGIPWIGEIPAHWEVRPSRYLVDSSRPVMYGIVLPGPHVEGGIPVVKANNCRPGRLVRDRMKCTTREIESRYVRSRLREDDVVIAIRGSVGSTAIVPEELAGANLTQDAARLAPSPKLSSRWLWYLTMSPWFSEHITPRITGSTVKGVNIWDLARVPLPDVPTHEQVRIATTLDGYLHPIDAATDATTKSIERLQEYRQALITAAVTGQLDIPEEAA